MNEDPSHPPTRNQPAFCQAAAGKDWDAAAERSHWWAVTAWEDLVKDEQQLNVSKISGRRNYDSWVSDISVTQMQETLISHLQERIMFYILSNITISLKLSDLSSAV